MSQIIQVNGQTINYPETGDTNWPDDATNFAIQTSAALGKIGLSSGTSVDITQTLDVTGNTTLDANLSVGGNTTLTGNLTVNGNAQLGNANTDTIGVNGIVNIDSGVLYVDPVNNRVGINDTTPSVALDVTGDISASGNLSVNGNTTLGDTSGDSLTINSNGVSIPNGLNFDSNTFVIDATNNRVGIGVANPAVPLDLQANSSALALTIRGRSSDNAAQLRFANNAGTNRYAVSLEASTDNFVIYNASSVPSISINQTGQLSAVVPGGSTLYNGYLCRAWVNFNGTLVVNPGTSTGIRASGNVSSITDNGPGDYTVNFTNAMPNSDYSVVSGSVSSNSTGPVAMVANPRSLATANFRVTCDYNNGTRLDFEFIYLAVFR